MLQRWTRRGASRGPQIRPVTAQDVALRHAVIELCEAEPVTAVMMRRHVDAMGRRSAAYGQLYARVQQTERGPRVDAALWSGANLIALGDKDALSDFAELAASQGRRCSSIVGHLGHVTGLWDQLREVWSPPREERLDQPVLVKRQPSSVAPDPRLRFATVADTGAIVPAAIAMYTEEVGYDPRRFGAGYEHHIRSQIREGRTFVITEDDTPGSPVVFAAEVGVLAGGVAQIHGVWVEPRLRGRGIGSAAMAGVCELTTTHLAETVSLYVNSYNAPAMRIYQRTGFEQVATFATILF